MAGRLLGAFSAQLAASFLRTSSARGGGGERGWRCQTFFFACSADHERDCWCKVVFSGWQPIYTLNVRNNILLIVREESRPTCSPLTSSCDPPLLFVYSQVNTYVSYYLRCVEDICDDGASLCPSASILNPNPMHLPPPLIHTLTQNTYYSILHVLDNVTHNTSRRTAACRFIA